MFRYSFLAIVIIITGISVSNAQNLNGHWFGKVSDGNSGFPLLFILQQKNDDISGKVVTPLGSRELSNCRIQGDSLHFIDKYGSNTLYHDARVYRDSIEIRMKGLWGKNNYYHFTVYRKKSLKNSSMKADSVFISKQFHY